MTGTVDAPTFKAASGRFLTGVTVVTANSDDGAPVGMTANAFTSVSLDPPLVLVCVARSAASFEALTTSPHFGIHVLGEQQEHVSTLFAKSAADGVDKFREIAWHWDDVGVPLIEGAVARFLCEVADKHPAGDHVILVGRVRNIQLSDSSQAPLGFLGSRYVRLADPSQRS